MSQMKMANAVYAIVALLVATSQVSQGKEFDCEQWRKRLSPHIIDNIICGQGGMKTLCGVLIGE